MKTKARVVIDSNVFISALLTPHRTAGKVILLCRERQIDMVFSETTYLELATRLFRPKFDKYVTSEQRVKFLALISELAVFEEPTQQIFDCRDPEDNKFLELALEGQVDAIVTGDEDLLALHPFRTIPVHNPAEFLKCLDD